MSHTTNLQVRVCDLEVLEVVCERLGLQTKEGKHRLYASTEEGVAIQLPGWKYPVIVKSNGNVAYDNYNGSWGNIQELNKLLAYYGLEKAKKEARKKGLSFYERINDQTQEIELVIKV